MSGLHRGENPQPGCGIIRSVRRRFPGAFVVGLVYDALESGIYAEGGPDVHRPGVVAQQEGGKGEKRHQFPHRRLPRQVDRGLAHPGFDLAGQSKPPRRFHGVAHNSGEADAKQLPAMIATFIGLQPGAVKNLDRIEAAAKGKVVLLPPFSLNTTNSLNEVEQHMARQQFLNVATGIPVGSVSPFIPTGDGGAVIYVQRKLQLDEKKAEAELPEFLAMMRQARQQEAFQQWFGIEASRELGSLPIFRRPAEMGSAGN